MSLLCAMDRYVPVLLGHSLPPPLYGQTYSQLGAVNKLLVCVSVMSCVSVSQLPSVPLHCCVVTPAHGLEQLLWRRELELARVYHLREEGVCDWTKTEELIRHWEDMAGDC